jgi:hypothetical protein
MQQSAGSYTLPQGHLSGIAGKRVGVYPRARARRCHGRARMIDRSTRNRVAHRRARPQISVTPFHSERVHEP